MKIERKKKRKKGKNDYIHNRDRGPRNDEFINTITVRLLQFNRTSNYLFIWIDTYSNERIKSQTNSSWWTSISVIIIDFFFSYKLSIEICCSDGLNTIQMNS